MNDGVSSHPEGSIEQYCLIWSGGGSSLKRINKTSKGRFTKSSSQSIFNSIFLSSSRSIASPFKPFIVHLISDDGSKGCTVLEPEHTPSVLLVQGEGSDYYTNAVRHLIQEVFDTSTKINMLTNYHPVL